MFMLGVENSVVIMVTFQSSRRSLSLWEELQYEKEDLNWGSVCGGSLFAVTVLYWRGLGENNPLLLLLL